MTKARIARHYTWKRDVPPKTGWSGQGVSKAGQQDIAVEFGTVPPKAGRLTRMYMVYEGSILGSGSVS